MSVPAPKLEVAVGEKAVACPAWGVFSAPTLSAVGPLRRESEGAGRGLEGCAV